MYLRKNPINLKKYLLLSIVFGLISSCKTETFELDKLSSQTGLTPSWQLPVAQIDLGIKTFLDSLDLEVDDQRDAYGTIYLKDTINDLGSVKIADIFDINDFTTTFDKTYSLEPISLDGASYYNDSVSFGSILGVPDGTTSAGVPPIALETVDSGTIDFFGSSFGEVTFQSGTLAFDVQNGFPIPVTLTVRLVNNAGVTVLTSTPTDLAQGASEEITLDLSSFTLEDTGSIAMDLQSPGTTNSVTVDATQQLSIDASYRNVLLSKAEIASPISIDYTFEQEVGFSSLDGEKLSQLDLEKGTFNIELIHDFGVPVKVSIESSDAEVSANPFDRTYNVSAASSPQNFDWNMDDVVIRFAHNGSQSYFTLQYTLEISLLAGQVIEANKTMQVSGSFTDLVLTAAYGDFGMKTSSFTETLEIDEDLTDFIDKFKLFEPKFDLIVNSTLGVPATYAIDASAFRKDGSFLDFEAPTVNPVILAPTQLLDTAQTRITYDNTNSNIEDFISFIPDDYISADLTFTTNPDGPPTTTNFLHKDSKIWVDAEVEAPVHFNISNFSISDTVRFEPPLKDEEDVDRILAASLYMHFTSDIPLNTRIHTSLIDTLTNSVLVDFDTFEMNAASTNEIGEVIAASEFTSELDFSDDQISALKEGNGLTMTVEVDSEENQTKNVKISSSARIKLSVAAKLKVQIDE